VAEQGRLADLAEIAAAATPAVCHPVHLEVRETATVGQPTLRLGQIGERLGFALTAEFLASLGFAHAATDRAAKLYHESSFPSMCAALTRHISAVQAKQAV
jgi:hypothetical protein